MINYDDNNIIVGYIKQILSSFNFFDIDVLKDDTKAIPNHHYIKNNSIVWCNSNKKLIKEFNYKYNDSISNLTHKFVNNSLVYDNNTHIHLGKYLKFLRDYKNINLMPLYNYFSNTLCDSLFLKNTKAFENYDLNYFKTYSIPVDFFETYSIYIGCDSRIELVCSFGDTIARDSENRNVEKKIQDLTRISISNSSFDKPIIFDKLSWEKLSGNQDLADLYKNKSNLKLLIKLPIKNNSSIVILNGIYNNYNDYYIQDSKKMIYNVSINNYEGKVIGEDKFDKNILNENLISPLSLIRMNTKVSHPFSDRLIEYLSENAINPLDKISDNFKGLYAELSSKGCKLNASEYGLWQDKMRNCLYDIEANAVDQYFDILGYCDKDAEKLLGKDADIYTSERGNDL